MGNLFKRATLAVALMLCAACTTSQVEVPGLAGPSELALSIRVAAIPDSISQDGASQSSIVVTAFDSKGKACGSLPVRLDMSVGGSIQDFGTLSARTIVTGSNGQASAVYTAPAAPPPSSGGSGTMVTIVATPSSSVSCGSTPAAANFDAVNPQLVSIRLVPPGVILPPAGTPTAAFVVTPTPVTVNTPALFDGSTSTPGSGAISIASYNWDFGDGSSGSGKTVTHSFSSAKTYNVSLTVTNDRGLSATAVQAVTPQTATSAGLAADFKFSPDKAVPNQPVTFDASISVVPPGDSITDYAWSFGDDTNLIHTSSPLIQHTYFVASNGSYTVVLTITDRFGNTAVSKPASIPVTGVGKPASAKFVMNPDPAAVGGPVTFDASASGPGAGGGNVVNYQWDFGDGTTGTGVSAVHTYLVAGSKTVGLTVVTDQGNTGNVTHILQVF
jgi:PKD repeat protein